MSAKPCKRRWKTANGEVREAWTVRYTGPDGRRVIKQFDKKRDADDFAAKLHGELRDGTHVPDSLSPTVAEACDLWIEAVKRGRGNHGPAEASTLRNYQRHVDAHIKPKLGTVRLNKLNKAGVMGFRNDLLAELSRASAQKVLKSLKGVLSEMQDQGRVAVNAAAKVQIGLDRAAKQETVVVPSRADVSALLTKLDQLCKNVGQADALRITKAWRRRRALIATAIRTGLRASELRGLAWANVDLAGATITVAQRADEKGNIGACKSTAGRRKVAMSPALVKLLREWKLECPPSDLDLVFPAEGGKPQTLANIYNRAWAPLQLAAGVVEPVRDADGKVQLDDAGKPVVEPRYNFHALRHFRASMLIAENGNPKEVQVEMGHATIQVTFDLYGHLFHDDAATARRAERAARIDGLLAG